VPIFRLTDDHKFPPVSLAEDGIIAVGGDLKPLRLLEAYRSGIFPWYNEDEPIIWWAPDPRFVLFPDELKISHTMRQLLKKQTFEVTFNQDFPAVIRACASTPRYGQPGTWIHPEMIDAYESLFHTGHARSVEVWQNDKLVGGLYGVQVGKVFCGESMFHRASNASKYGFIRLVQRLKEEGTILVDCQLHTAHLESLGARFISREEYLKFLLQNRDI
jgi:leucyl/phenylalanyl-tRNA---protein transferase